MATNFCKLDTVKYLVTLTDTPMVPNNDGQTPIFIAAAFGHLQVVKFLVGLTESPNTPDNNGTTPIEIARTYRHFETAKFLEKQSSVLPSFCSLM